MIRRVKISWRVPRLIWVTCGTGLGWSDRGEREVRLVIKKGVNKGEISRELLLHVFLWQNICDSD